jgi:hypothetical protein
MSSPSSIISLGLGAWGSASLVVTMGLGVGIASKIPPALRKYNVTTEARIEALRFEQRRFSIAAEVRIEALQFEQRYVIISLENKLIEVRNDIH